MGSVLGVTLDTQADELRLYTSQRIAQLALAVGEPGYEEAVRREALHVFAKSAGRAVAVAVRVQPGVGVGRPRAALAAVGASPGP